jgi:mannose-6-phosphate isomerase class I
MSPSPVVLQPDNFTPTSRTPWGGHHIVERYKPFLAIDGSPPVVGESWELSVEPDFPSRVLGTGATLRDVIAADPAAWLGDEFARGRMGTALLVKLLDAAEPLSVQIHPCDTYRGLREDESGKPESWFILRRDPGAGLYLGLKPDVTQRDIEHALRDEADVSELMQFVAVEPGDFFLIEAGTPHAVGKGVTLVEPQHVAPGKRGVTYRFWDWNRRYTADGRRADLTPTHELAGGLNGKPRELHVEHALGVMRWDAPRGDEQLAQIRSRNPRLPPGHPATLTPLCGPGPDCPIRSDVLHVRLLQGTGTVEPPRGGSLVGLTVMEGTVTLRRRAADLVVPAGHTAAIPAAHDLVAIESEGALALLSSAL